MAQHDGDHSIFLSYARVDNESETNDKSELGWVDYFQSRLIKQMRRRGRLDVAFWRDVAEIDGADRFSPKILDGLVSSHFFLPILSPTYIQRPWCREEVQRFNERGTNEPDINQRLVPVFKLPVEESQLPQQLRGRGGYRFYRNDEVNKRLVEFFRRGEEQDPEAYSTLLDEITDFICSKLPPVEALSQIPNPEPSSKIVSIFVAPPASDMYAAYDKLVSELKTQGLRVVIDPSQEISTDRVQAEADVAEALDQARLAIHLLGAESGPRLGKSRLADFLLEQSHSREIPRIIWAPTMLFSDPTRPESTMRIQDRDPLAVFNEFGEFRNTDSVSGDPFEAFLLDVVRRCQYFQKSTDPGQPVNSNGHSKIYVVGASDDAGLVHQVTGTLIEAHGLKAFPCGFQGADSEKRRLHEEEMRDADVVLYCWGAASDTSIQFYLREIRDTRKLGRENPFRATALFPGPPISDYKKSFRSADVSLRLEPSDEIKPDIFLPLVDALANETST